MCSLSELKDKVNKLKSYVTQLSANLQLYHRTPDSDLDAACDDVDKAKDIVQKVSKLLQNNNTKTEEKCLDHGSDDEVDGDRFFRNEDRNYNHGSPDLYENTDSTKVVRDSLDDLENFDDFTLSDDEDKANKSTGSIKSKAEECCEIKHKMSSPVNSESHTSKEEVDDFDDFGDVDFDDDMLQEIDEAEKSVVVEQDISGGETEEVEVEDDIQNQPEDKKYLTILKQFFGYSRFRPMQWKIVNAVINERRDMCVVMATGHGKSLCYQYPAVCGNKTVVVVSPLISLMQDQVLALEAANIEACFLGSAQENMFQVKKDMMKGKYRVVYITPEFASTDSGILQSLNETVGIQLIAIDEAHCVSQWGHDFRSAYRSLGQLHKTFPSVPVMALTATATHEVRQDICKSLGLKNPLVICTGFDRPNLFLSVSNKSSNIMGDLQSQMNCHGNRYSFDGPTIIYCPTKKATMNVATVLQGMRVPCAAYHAGLSQNIRNDSHNKFVNDKIQVVIATVAFGMGIDKPDVRKVIHYGAPKDIESYYQEIGRGGRDGMPSTCHVFYAPADFNVSRHFIHEVKNPRFKEHKLKMLSKMEEYLSTSKCRRRFLLSHFESKNVDEIGGTENCCDFCRKKIEMGRQQTYYDSKNWSKAVPTMNRDEEQDYCKEAKDLFSAIEVLGGYYGMMAPVRFLMGSSHQQVSRFSSHRMFGKGKYKKMNWWKAFGKMLMFGGYLLEKPLDSGFGSIIQLSSTGRAWLQSNDPDKSLKLTPTRDMIAEEKPIFNITVRPDIPVNRKPFVAVSPEDRKSTPAKVSRPVVVVDEKTQALQSDLYTQLVKQRNDLSQETGFYPHSIASNKVLLSMAKIRPSSKEKLVMLEDFPEAKVEKFGATFLKIIVPFCKEHDIKCDDFPEIEVEQSDTMSGIMKLTDTQRMTYVLYDSQKQSVEEIASGRGLKTSTVITHLCEALKVGLEVNIESLGVTPSIRKLITDTIRGPLQSDISRLTQIKDHLPLHIEYNHIKVVIAILTKQYGQEMLPDNVLVLGGRKQDSDQTPVLSTSAEDSQSNCQADSIDLTDSQQDNSQSSGSKRKLPAWMSSQPKLSKKMKSNSLFRR